MCQKGKLSWCQIVLVPNCPIIFWFRPNSGRNLQKQQESEARPGEKFPSSPSPPFTSSPRFKMSSIFQILSIFYQNRCEKEWWPLPLITFSSPLLQFSDLWPTRAYLSDDTQARPRGFPVSHDEEKEEEQSPTKVVNKENNLKFQQKFKMRLASPFVLWHLLLQIAMRLYQVVSRSQ